MTTKIEFDTKVTEEKRPYFGMGNHHLHISNTLRHVTQWGEWTSDRLQEPHQMSYTIRIFRNSSIFGMRKLPVERLRFSTIAQQTQPIISTVGLGFLRRMVSSIINCQAIWFSMGDIAQSLPITIAGFIVISRRSRKTCLFPQNLGECIPYILSDPPAPALLRILLDSWELVLLLVNNFKKAD